MNIDYFLTLLRRDLDTLKALLKDPQIYEEYVFFNPALHHPKETTKIKQRIETLAKAIQNDDLKALAETELELCLLKAKKHHLKLKIEKSFNFYFT